MTATTPEVPRPLGRSLELFHGLSFLVVDGDGMLLAVPSVCQSFTART